MSGFFNFLQKCQSAFGNAFLPYQAIFYYPYQQGNNNNNNKNKPIFYPSQFFNMGNFEGPWTEIARTPNSLQGFDNTKVTHMFGIPFGYNSPEESCYPVHQPAQSVSEQVTAGMPIDYTVSREDGDARTQHSLNVNTSGGNVTFTEPNDNLFDRKGNMHVVGIYDQDLNLVTNPNDQTYSYAILAQHPGNCWILSRHDCESNSKATTNLVNFAKRLGYNVNATNANHKSSGHDVLVFWTPDYFPSDGNGRVINVDRNKIIRFKSPDGEFHTVAQAIREKDNREPTGYRWVPHSDPFIPSPEGENGFNRTLRIGEPGTYFLVCPVGTNHRTMRIQINVHDSQKPHNSHEEQTEDVISGINEYE